MSLLLLVAACTSSAGSPTTTTASPPTTSRQAPPLPVAGSTVTTTTTSTDATERGRFPSEEIPLRTDLLTFAHGAVVVTAAGLTGNSDDLALAMIDGSDDLRALVVEAEPSVSVVIRLPAPTIFDAFALPAATMPSSGETFFRSVTIDGSDAGPAGPWVVLARADFSVGQAQAEVAPVSSLPVSWIRVSLEDGLTESETTHVFAEIAGYGTQDEIPFEERFTGSWEVRQFDSLDSSGRPLTLSQSGTVISGCLGDLVVTGTVDGAVARALATDPGFGRGRALLLVPDDDGELIVALTNDSDRIQAARGVVSSLGASCNAPPPEPPSCGDTVHILFDVDSADIRRDSERVLDDLFEGLGSATASSITIIGHTSTEGDEAHNQELSERRAAAIVDALIDRGFDEEIITSEGRGEAEPLVTPELDEASRSLNRRVEVSCTP